MACFLAPMSAVIVTTAVRKRVSEKWHLNWLNSMLWGGVVMLAVEHISHREVVPYPPFLTKGLSEVLPEILSKGIPMVLAVGMVWLVMVGIVNLAERAKKVKWSEA
ncbi:MAG: hypothetical protein NC821_02700 [Candidatus Omnitrophica bacterium]|nr:hypothetical protein [Candidatus Omnitrophota bacterium]